MAATNSFCDFFSEQRETKRLKPIFPTLFVLERNHYKVSLLSRRILNLNLILIYVNKCLRFALYLFCDDVLVLYDIVLYHLRKKYSQNKIHSNFSFIHLSITHSKYG